MLLHESTIAHIKALRAMAAIVGHNLFWFSDAYHFAGTSSLLILQLDSSSTLLGRESSSVLRRLSSSLWRTLFHQQVCENKYSNNICGTLIFLHSRWPYDLHSHFILLLCFQLLWCLLSMKRTRTRTGSSIWLTVARTPSGCSRWRHSSPQSGRPTLASLLMSPVNKTCQATVYILVSTSHVIALI